MLDCAVRPGRLAAGPQARCAPRLAQRPEPVQSLLMRPMGLDPSGAGRRSGGPPSDPHGDHDHGAGPLELGFPALVARPILRLSAFGECPGEEVLGEQALRFRTEGPALMLGQEKDADVVARRLGRGAP